MKLKTGYVLRTQQLGWPNDKSVLDLGLIPSRVKPVKVKLMVFTASLLDAQY